jgi:FdhD protein
VTDRVSIAQVVRMGSGTARPDQDLVAVEAPLVLTVAHPDWSEPRRFGVLMRTPGHDVELAIGLLYGEGVIRSRDDVAAIDATTGPDGEPALHVTLRPSVDASTVRDRAQTMTSACGLCGRLSVDRADLLARRGTSADAVTFSATIIQSVSDTLRRHQAVFAETGGLHAAALIDSSGVLQLLREDVGRHNAVDKIVGAALDAGWLPATRSLLAVSGRVAYEIVQKAALSGVSAVVAVGAPSSLAVEAARACHLTLIGFARDGRFNVYAGSGSISS